MDRVSAPPPCDPNSRNGAAVDLGAFGSDLVDRVRASGNVLSLPGGQILLPRVFGFCRGVKRAITMVDQACRRHCGSGKRLFLLGQIIHNPWVNNYFSRQQCISMLTADQIAELERHVHAEDCAVIPAFGVRPSIHRRLDAIGSEVVNTSCGDVRKLWAWAEHAAQEGSGVMIFGRAGHDETVVTKSRLDEAGGAYVVVGNLDQTDRFCDMIVANASAGAFRSAFGDEQTNADGLEPFLHLAQVSQTTMLYDDTMRVRQRLREAFNRRFGPDQAERRLLLQPTVCHATQNRQAAAVELCSARLDVVVVVGGFGSSNTRHLYELAREHAAAVFVEDADAILSQNEVRKFDLALEEPVVATDWLPRRRPIRIGVLAGASSPEVVVGEVLEKLSGYLSA